MIRRPPRSTHVQTLFPYTTLFRSTPSTPVASVSPETDARASTTWRLQPPSASLVLWRKPRNPPSVAACAIDSGVDATTAARPELLHGNSPSTLNARVPAIQRPSTRSHRTVDNSLITSRIEYSRSSLQARFSLGTSRWLEYCSSSLLQARFSLGTSTNKQVCCLEYIMV